MSREGHHTELYFGQSEMNPHQKYPHLNHSEVQALHELNATNEQYAKADTAAKNQIDYLQARYKPGPTKLALIVTGTSGAGKSATANTILGGDYFREGCSTDAVTLQTQVENRTVDGLDLTVIDTPGSWETQLAPQVLVDVGSNYVVVLVINIASPRFGKNQLDEIRNLKGPDGTLLLNSGRCLVVLSHADGALLQFSLTDYLREIEGDPLHTLLTQDLQGNILAINNAAMTPYERQKQQRSLFNAITKTLLVTVDSNSRSCCGYRFSKGTSKTFRVMAISSVPVVTAVLGMLFGLFIRCPSRANTYRYILGGGSGAVLTAFLFMLRKKIKSKPFIGLAVVGGAVTLGLVMGSQYMEGALAGCAFTAVGLFARAKFGCC